MEVDPVSKCPHKSDPMAPAMGFMIESKELATMHSIFYTLQSLGEFQTLDYNIPTTYDCKNVPILQHMATPSWDVDCAGQATHCPKPPGSL